MCVAVCCSVLQCVAVCCSVLQCVAVCCSVLQCVAVSVSVFFDPRCIYSQLEHICKYWTPKSVVQFCVPGTQLFSNPLKLSFGKLGIICRSKFLKSDLLRAREITVCERHLQSTYSQLQIGWHWISRFFLQLFQRTRILPMGFTIIPSNKMINPKRILVRLVLNWKF